MLVTQSPNRARAQGGEAACLRRDCVTQMPCMSAQQNGCAPTANQQPTYHDEFDGGAHKNSLEGNGLIRRQIDAREAVQNPTHTSSKASQENQHERHQINGRISANQVQGVHGSTPLARPKIKDAPARRDERDGQRPEQDPHGSLLVFAVHDCIHGCASNAAATPDHSRDGVENQHVESPNALNLVGDAPCKNWPSTKSNCKGSPMEKAPDGTTPRRIRDALDVGSANGGHDVRLNLRMEDGSTEWFDVDHKHVARLVAGILFASGIAKRERPAYTPSGNPIPQANELISPSGMSFVRAPEGVVLQVQLSPEVSLDFQIPEQALPDIAKAAKELQANTSQGGKASSLQ